MSNSKTTKWDSTILKGIVDATHIRVEDLAGAIGISYKSLRNYLAGTSAPGIDALIAIAKYFCIPVDCLLGLTNFENYDSFWERLKNISYSQYLLKGKQDNVKIPDGYISPFPYNLYEKIFDKLPEELLVLTFDQCEGLIKAINLLPERGRDIILGYYKYGNTLDELAEEYSVTRERIRQIIIKNVKKLRHPSRKTLIINGVKGADVYNLQRKLDVELEKLEQQKAKIQEMEEEISKKEERLGIEAIPYKCRSITLDELDISTRSYNCLKRAGLTTVGDIVERFESEESFYKIRNMGQKCAIEVRNKIFEQTGIAIHNEFFDQIDPIIVLGKGANHDN